MLKRNFVKFLLLSLLGFIFSNISLAEQKYPYQYKLLQMSPTVESFIVNVSSKDHYNKLQLRALLSHAQYIPEVIQRMTSPFEARPWKFYRDYFVGKKRIAEGVRYWDEHAKTLAIVEKKYGVPANIIVAIIGIESYYGKHMGHYQELGALATLAFYYQPRAQFFRRELMQYLVLARSMDLAPLKVTGSYAGALGIPQFMPSSYRRYAVSLNKGKKIDLLHNSADAMASIACYLRKAGWRSGEPVAEQATFPKKVPERFISTKGFPTATLGELITAGVKPAEDYNKQLKADLIPLKNTHSTEYWIGFKNFKAIMHYNTSINYAMAVFQLSVAIAKAHHEQNITRTSSAAAAAKPE